MPFEKGSRNPTAEEAVHRLIVLQCVVVHSIASPPLEIRKELVKGMSRLDFDRLMKDVEEQRDEHWGQLRKAGLWDCLLPWELALASTTALTLPEKQRINGIWRLEALQTIAWALQIVPKIPGYDQEADMELLKHLSSSEAAPFIKSPVLRDSATIEKARELAEFWHWRSRTRCLIEQEETFPADPNLKAQGIASYEDAVRIAAQQGSARGDLPDLIDGDFSVKGKAYRDLSDEEWSEVRSLTMERHFALNWLCGHAPGNQWDETPTPT